MSAPPAPGYKPRQSGLLANSVGKPSRRPRTGILKNGIQDCHLSDRSSLKTLPEFDLKLEFEYSKRELILLAEKILLDDPKPPYEHPAILFTDALLQRKRKEIYVGQGTPEHHIVHGMYWRTHPNGRKFRSLARRQELKGPGFYYS